MIQGTYRFGIDTAYGFGKLRGMADKRTPPTPDLRNWMTETGTDEKTLAEKLAAIGCKVSVGSVRQAADYRMPGHRMASALVVVTGIPYGRLRPAVKFAASESAGADASASDPAAA